MGVEFEPRIDSVPRLIYNYPFTTMKYYAFIWIGIVNLNKLFALGLEELWHNKKKLSKKSQSQSLKNIFYDIVWQYKYLITGYTRFKLKIQYKKIPCFDVAGFKVFEPYGKKRQLPWRPLIWHVPATYCLKKIYSAHFIRLSAEMDLVRNSKRLEGKWDSSRVTHSQK